MSHDLDFVDYVIEQLQKAGGNRTATVESQFFPVPLAWLADTTQLALCLNNALTPDQSFLAYA